MEDGRRNDDTRCVAHLETSDCSFSSDNYGETVHQYVGTKTVIGWE